MPSKGTRKPDRLQKRSDFLRLQNGRKWVSPTVIVQVEKGEKTSIRVGFTATKKLGGATVRNRVKRRMRAAARAALADVPGVWDLVLIGRAETATCPYQSLLKDLKWCLKRLEVTGHEKPADTPA
ncbi:MAG: ribonuclease P protein component [Alphaproteobacteria bacterium]|nr:ribonuclease P protein component [Alphaproteobacteria bacterium]